MYDLRTSIHNDRPVEDGLDSVKQVLGEQWELLMNDTLLARDPDDGQNLLMNAAAWGKKDWFLHLLRDIRQRVSKENTCAP